MTIRPDHQQLTLALPHHTALDLQDFYESESNRQALRAVLTWPDWVAPTRMLMVTGPEGCGKTHLAHVWMQRSGAIEIDIDNQDIFNLDGAAVVIEDVDRITQAEDEEKLFHIYNHINNTGGWLMMTSSKPIAHINLTLPDLQSRLKSTANVTIEEPDDTLLKAILQKHFNDRQLSVNEGVLNYCMSRMERSFSAAANMVEQLDEKSLSEKRSITIPMVKQAGL